MTDLSAARLQDLFGAVGYRYRHATRMARDLRSRVEALDAERARWLEAFADDGLAARARLELKEIDALRPRVERSAVEWAERARALELIVGTCIVEASVHPFRHRRADATTPEPAQVTALAPPPPILWPDVGPQVVPTVVCSDPDASPT
jgi:hypothetical protein